MHFSHAAPRRNMLGFAGHHGSRAIIDVTQNFYGKSWWEAGVDALTQAVEASISLIDTTEGEQTTQSCENAWLQFSRLYSLSSI